MKVTTAALHLCVLLAACSRPTAQQQQNAATAGTTTAADATARTVAAAEAFLATLDDGGRTKISFDFNNQQKSKWSNFPVGVYPRNGVRWGDLNATQRDAALRVLSTALSKRGLQKVQQIMEGDEVLKAAEALHGSGPMGSASAGTPMGGTPAGGTMNATRAGGRPMSGAPMGGRRAGAGPPTDMAGPKFGRDEYYLAFLGAPSLTQPWMIQFGGHHLAINVTMVGRTSVLTPSLPAAQPAIYKLDGQTVRPLGSENDKSFALINALDATQQTKAILAYQVSDLVLGPGEDGKTIQPEGIKASDLTAAQQRMLLDLAHEWVGILNDEAAAAKMAELEAGLPETWFAWSGPTTNGSSAYFRIQGPTLLIEYAPQRARGSTGLDLDHIHTIYRDPTNDYGARLVHR